MEQHLITANQANALLAYLERQPLTLQIQALAQMVQNLPIIPPTTLAEGITGSGSATGSFEVATPNE